MVSCPFCSQPCEPRTSAARAVVAACAACLNPLVVRVNNGAYETEAIQCLADMRQALGNSVGGDLLKKVPEHVETLPVMPRTAKKILKLLKEPNHSASDLAASLSEDQVTALKALELANATYYSGLDEITSIATACARLGSKTLADAAGAMAKKNAYKTRCKKNEAIMQNLWRHALATAWCATDIAAMLAEPEAETFFIAGLVHDIGKLLIFDIVTNNRIESARPLVDSPELMREIMHGYHALAGLHIAQHWRLPQQITVAIFCHDKPDLVPDTAWLTIAHTVALASAIANKAGYGLGYSENALTTLPSAKFLNVKDTRLAALRVDLEDRMDPLLED